MKRYTLKKLPPSTQESTEDIRLSFAKSRKQYLQDAFKDLFLNETLIMRVILIILTRNARCRPPNESYYLLHRNTYLLWEILLDYKQSLFVTERK